VNGSFASDISSGETQHVLRRLPRQAHLLQLQLACLLAPRSAASRVRTTPAPTAPRACACRCPEWRRHLDYDQADTDHLEFTASSTLGSTSDTWAAGPADFNRQLRIRIINVSSTSRDFYLTGRESRSPTP
jgi:hypothetical protein